MRHKKILSDFDDCGIGIISCDDRVGEGSCRAFIWIGGLQWSERHKQQGERERAGLNPSFALHRWKSLEIAYFRHSDRRNSLQINAGFFLGRFVVPIFSDRS
jgi:hypothetical protein